MWIHLQVRRGQKEPDPDIGIGDAWTFFQNGGGNYFRTTHGALVAIQEMNHFAEAQSAVRRLSQMLDTLGRTSLEHRI
jgi:hypothetical protein